MKKRLCYGAAAVLLIAVEVLIALYVHDSFIRPHIGDVLVVVVLYLLVRTVVPEGWPWLPLGIFLFAVCVEGLQAIGIADRLGLSGNRVLRTLIGGTFDPGDIVCYAAGCALLGVCERMRYRKRGSRETSNDEKAK